MTILNLLQFRNFFQLFRYNNKRMVVLHLLAMKFSSMSCSKSNYSEFPVSLKGFGYGFNKEGQLRKLLESGEVGEEPFNFVVKSNNHNYNQMHYEALGEVIEKYVYNLLENECNLKKFPIPIESSPDIGTFIFASEDAFENSKLIVLIHGSGVVRAGQWSRRLIINDCLNSGTQIPYIKKAKELGYGVIVLNSNDNNRYINGKDIDIKGSSSPVEHTLYAWDHYIQKSKANRIAIIAHSYGGVCVTELVNERCHNVKNRLFAIALTDSVVRKIPKKVSDTCTEVFKQISRNWVQSQEPLDKQLDVGGIPEVSAGTIHHELTSWVAIKSVFNFIERKYVDFNIKGEL